MAMSIVEETLHSQREIWKDIVERTSRISMRDLVPEPPKRIFLFGLGSSYFAARLSAYALMRDRSRPRIPIVACSSMAIGPEHLPQKGEWAIAFSHRGQSRPTVKGLEIAEQAGAFTVMVSAQGTKELDCVKYMLPTSPLERCEPHTMAVTGAICAVTTLLSGQKVAEEWDALRSFPDPDLALYRDRAKTGPAVILGEWEGEWVAREAALKLMEMARLPVRVFGAEEYFHGPRFSVKPDERLWHVALPRDKRTPEIKADHRIEVPGSSPLAWVPALVELQWMSLAVALNLGVNPDQP